MIISFSKQKIKRKTDEILIESYLLKGMSKEISDFFKFQASKDVIVVCIGSNRTDIIDFLGPFVGSILKEDRDFNIPVYGSMVNPINAINLSKRIIEIKNNHPNSKIIAVDACLSDEEEIGKILIDNGPVHPGSVINNKCPSVGDICIKGIVGPTSVDILKYSADRKFIGSMAYAIAKGLKDAFKII